jgi:cell division FtsZ-interacting protein ZapD
MDWGRDSAGAPPKPGGLLEFRLPYGEVRRHHTFTCRHCGVAQWIPPHLTIEDVAKCFICWGLVCKSCEPKGDCKEAGEFMKKIEAAERRERLLAAAGIRD